MSSRFNTGDELVVHKGSDFVADCVCNGTVQFVWTGNAATTKRTDINNSHIGISTLTLRNASKQDEGRLCCGLSDCRPLIVIDKPVFTLSASEIECSHSKDKGSRNVSIRCSISSTVRTNLVQGYMLVFKNNKETLSYDNSPSNSTNKDASGNTIYTKTYEFAEKVLDGDSLYCRWIRQDGNIFDSESKLVVEFRKCLEPATSFNTTDEDTTTRTTTDGATKPQGNKKGMRFSVSFGY